MELFVGFFETHVVFRASLLVHEARHWNGSHHDDTDRDVSWEQHGAYWSHVRWLASYAKNAVNASKGMRCYAKRAAQVMRDDENNDYFVNTPPPHRYKLGIDCSEF